LVDLGHFTSGNPVQIAGFVGHFGRALENIGFVAIENPGIDPQLLQQVYGVAQEFFALPTATKQQYQDPELQGQRGFTGLGQEHAKNRSIPDLKEFWHMGPEFAPDHPLATAYPANVWPKEIPQFQPLLTQLHQQLEICSHALLQACSLYIGTSRHLLCHMTEDGNTVLRVLHYPQMAEVTHPGALRAAPHEDINLITLLCDATQPGLEVQQRDGSWLAVQLEPGQLLCNVGDMLQWFTNGLLRSTTHQVVNTGMEDSPRFALPYFVHPRPGMDLAPLASCVAKTGGQVRFPPITARSYLKERLNQIGLG